MYTSAQCKHPDHATGRTPPLTSPLKYSERGHLGIHGLPYIVQLHCSPTENPRCGLARTALRGHPCVDSTTGHVLCALTERSSLHPPCVPPLCLHGIRWVLAYALWPSKRKNSPRLRLVYAHVYAHVCAPCLRLVYMYAAVYARLRPPTLVR
eukprot:4596361-Prymnesium_polylepis.2